MLDRRHALALLLCSAYGIELSGQSPPGDARVATLPEPFLRVAIDDPDVLTGTGFDRLVAGLLDVGARHARDRHEAVAWRSLVAKLGRPMEIAAIVRPDTGSLVVGAKLAPDAPPILGDLIELLRGETVRRSEVQHWGAVLQCITIFRYHQIETVAEGRFAGSKVLFLLADGGQAEAQLAFSELTEAFANESAPARALRERLPGGGARLMFSLPALLAELPARRADNVRATLARWVGPDCTGMLCRVTKQSDRLVVDTFLDLRAGVGLLGSLFPDRPQRLTLVQAAPEDADLMAVRIVPDKVFALLDGLEREQRAPFEGRAWKAARELLAGLDVPHFLEQLDGQFLMLRAPPPLAAIGNPALAMHAVLVFGCSDGIEAGTRLAATLRHNLPRRASLRVATAIGEGVLALCASDEQVLYLAQRPTYIALAGTDPECRDLLLAFLAGRNAGPPERLRALLGEDAAAPATQILCEHALTALADQGLLEKIRGQQADARFLIELAKIVDAAFVGDRAWRGSRVVVDPGGTRVHVVF